MKTTPYWWEDAEPEYGLRQFPSDKCSVLIVGSGYTGLSAAITLAEAGLSHIYVVDALRIGEGASSRNGGQIGNSPKFDLSYAVRKFGAQRGNEIMADYQESVSFLLQRAKTLEADFDLRINGAITGAHTRKDLEQFRRMRASLPPEQQANFEILAEHEVAQVLQTSIYRGALIQHDWGGLHPAKYVRALAQRARSLGVHIITGWRYMGAKRENSTYLADLRTSAGTEHVKISADKIFLAVNGYAGPELPWFRQRTIPMQSYMIATQPLPFEQMEALIPDNRVALDTKHILYYFRRSPDGTRMLFGGRARFQTSTEEQSAAGLRKFMIHTFPSLREASITHSWFGNVCFAYDFVSHVGRTKEGIYYSCCCNGNGIAMATYLGHRSGEMMLEKPGHDRGVVNTHFPRLYCYNGHPWFLPMVGAWYKFLDRTARWWD